MLLPTVIVYRIRREQSGLLSLSTRIEHVYNTSINSIINAVVAHHVDIFGMRDEIKETKDRFYSVISKPKRAVGGLDTKRQRL